MPTEQVRKRGRPSLYTPEIAEEICLRLSSGESLRAICRDDHMPEECTVRRWVIEDREGFSTRYTHARDIGLDAIADELLEIADTTQEGVKTKETPDGIETVTGDMIDHRKLRVDTRKWYLSKLAPKKYGDRLDAVSGPQITVMISREGAMVDVTPAPAVDRITDQSEDS